MLLFKNYNFLLKPKKIIHLFVLLILLAFCSKERNNPWDDKNTLKKDSWMVDNLKINVFKIDSINLTWELKNDKIEGVRIDRKIDEQPWVTNYAQVPNNILNFTDTAVNLLNHKYQYRLYAYAGNNLSSFLDTIVPKLNLPTINTTSITSISTTSAVSGGNITNDGGVKVTQRGVCWSTTPNPTISNDKTTDGNGKGSFISNLTGLSAGTIYYLRAYATNIVGTSYGNEVSFTTGQILPVLTTNPITSITSKSAVSGGNITNYGDDIISQRGVCWSISPNPTILNDKTTDGIGVGSFTSNLVGLSAGTTYYLRAYATNSLGTSYGNELSFTTVEIGTYLAGTVHCNGAPTTVVDVTNSITGKTWMDRNLGATRAATSTTDVQAYGDLYQWGRGSDGHQCRNSTTSGKLSNSIQPGHGDFILAPNSPWDWLSPQNNNLWQGENGINNPCPSGYRLPTEAEMLDELTSWNNKDQSGAFSSPLKLPTAGYRFRSDGRVYQAGVFGYYWTSNVSGMNVRSLRFNSNGASIGEDDNSEGQSVRCIKD